MRPLPISRPVLATLVASMALHASAAAVMRSGFTRAVASVASESPRIFPVDYDPPAQIEDAPSEAPAVAKDAPPPSPPQAVSKPSSQPAPRLVVPVSANQISPALVSSTTVDQVAPAESAPLRFVLANAVGTTATVGSAPNGTAVQTADGAGAVIPESRVSVPARLLARAQVSYPSAARASEIEADVRVEIVVDTAGRVATARCLRREGYGLDEAAVSAIRGYRFSPALVDGRPVRVRMLWTVQFRLG